MFHNIINAEQLHANLVSYDWLIIDARFNLADTEAGYKAYQAEHIPNAFYAHLDNDLSSAITETSGRHPLPEPEKLIRLCSRWGLDKNTQVVVYDDAQGAFAARLWWLLRWLGHDKVAVLDGGLQAWQAKSYELTSDMPEERNSECYLNAEERRDHWLTSSQDVVNNLSSQQFLLLDARAPERYRGEVEPIDPVAGHVPDAVNVPLGGNLNEQGHFLPKNTLRARYESILGDRSTEQIACMCGSGVTACHNLLAMSIAGLEGAKLYAGSWSEWIRDSDRPVATE